MPGVLLVLFRCVLEDEDMQNALKLFSFHFPAFLVQFFQLGLRFDLMVEVQLYLLLCLWLVDFLD